MSWREASTPNPKRNQAGTRRDTRYNMDFGCPLHTLSKPPTDGMAIGTGPRLQLLTGKKDRAITR